MKIRHLPVVAEVRHHLFAPGVFREIGSVSVQREPWLLSWPRSSDLWHGCPRWCDLCPANRGRALSLPSSSLSEGASFPLFGKQRGMEPEMAACLHLHDG